MKYLRTLFKLTIFIIIGIVINILIHNALSESKRDWIKTGLYYPREQWQEFYKLHPNTLDLVILGSSRSLYGISPQIIEEKTELNSFNLSSAAQPFPATYYCLQEVIEYHDIKYLILEIHYDMLTRFYTRPYKIYILENIKTKRRKLEFFWYGFKLREKAEFFLPILNDGNSLTYIFNKLTGNLHNELGDEIYVGKGFAKSFEKFDSNRYENITYDWNDNLINPEVIKYYNKIVQLAEENNIQLVVINFPYTNLVKFNNIERFKKKYRDFILISDNVILLDYHNDELNFSLEDYSDNQHLNWEGAQKLSLDIAVKLLLMN
ncbi:MAG: hypothetical protein P9X26_00640 [Candidatus Stygibacter frigidus]|nr:hypothetical protein [Candidatus Stygibacter frigidus]